LDVAGRVFHLVDEKLQFKKFLDDGKKADPGEFIENKHRASSIL
jgi:hypothetical protein